MHNSRGNELQMRKWGVLLWILFMLGTILEHYIVLGIPPALSGGNTFFIPALLIAGWGAVWFLYRSFKADSIFTVVWSLAYTLMTIITVGTGCLLFSS